MGDETPIDRSENAQNLPGQPDRTESNSACEYCGAPLFGMFYFCTACGTPYKNINLVLPPPTPRTLTDGERVRLQAPSAAPLFWTYFTVVLSCGLVSFLFHESRPELALILSGAAMFVTTSVFATLYWHSLKAQLKQPGFDHPVAFVALFLLLPGALAINWLYGYALTQGLGVEDAFPFRQLESSLGTVGLVVSLCAIPAITEEIAFRGLLQHWLQTAIHPLRGLVVASFLFATLHFSVLSLPYLFALGILLGWTKWRTRSLYPSVLIHFLHNAAVVAFF